MCVYIRNCHQLAGICMHATGRRSSSFDSQMEYLAKRVKETERKTDKLSVSRIEYHELIYTYFS